MSRTKCPKLEEKGEMVPIDNLVYKTFVEKFNKSYGDSLLGEQKSLLNNYIMSFADNGLQLKMFLNEEIPRLKNAVNEKLDKTKIEQILKIQNLVKEIISDG